MSVDAVLIAGPTASGKSAAALALAERFGAVIINADALQVYSELRVLTARPSPAEEARVPHRLYGHVAVTERYSAGRFQAEASEALAQARSARRLAIFVGGTGLYFEALEVGLSPIPSIPPDVRRNVRERLEALGRDSLFAELRRCDPVTAAKINPTDSQRLLRALQVLEATGRPLSEWQAMKRQSVLEGLKVERFVLAPPRDLLYERIGRRFERMVEEGALDEARSLSGLDPSLPAAKALGLRELSRHLAGEMRLDEAMEEAKLATRRYAKRQVTWFRNRMKGWKWCEHVEIGNFIADVERDLS